MTAKFERKNHSGGGSHRRDRKTLVPRRAKARRAIRPVGRPASGRSRPPIVAAVGLLCLVLGLGGAFAASDAFRSPVLDKPGKRPGSNNLVVNGDFESGITGWRVNQPYQRLEVSNTAAHGSRAAALGATVRGARVVIDDARDTVRAAEAGHTYLMTAQVRARGAEISGKARIREVAGGREIGVRATSFEASTTMWTKVAVSYVTKKPGSALDLNLVGWDVAPGQGLLVDKVTLVDKGQAKDPAPSPIKPASSEEPNPAEVPDEDAESAGAGTATSTSAPASQAAAGCVDDEIGIPSDGGAYLGATVGGTAGIGGREGELGAKLAMHRTSYQADQIDAAIEQAEDDLASGRLPWLSFMPPATWDEMAGGAGDDWTTGLAGKLAGVKGPVWLAIHPNPEQQGDLALWKKMQAGIATIIHERTDNVAYTVIYSGQQTFGDYSSPLPNKWPGDEHVDITAIDAYNEQGVVRDGAAVSAPLDVKTYFEPLAQWAAIHGTEWAVAGAGQTQQAAAEDPGWLARAWRDLVALGGSGLVYDDSARSPEADWALDDPARLERFATLLTRSKRVC
ncbi:MAG: carbohydrate binding domain-containing protein [Nocardioides sp.]